MSKVYTMKEVAGLLKCNVNRVNDLRRSGLLKCLKLGSWKVTETSLDEFLKKYDGKDLTDPNNVREVSE